jgi:hypothetical protein
MFNQVYITEFCTGLSSFVLVKWISFPNFTVFPQILEKVKIAYDLPIVTDVHEAIQVKSFYFSKI